jgi:uncharacterized delta-60 repeat protein
MKSSPQLSLALIVFFSFLTIRAWAGSGGWDQSYAPTLAGGPVNAMAMQPNDMLIVGGAFYSVDGSNARNHLARLYSDGTLDPSFLSTGTGVSGPVYAVALESNGSIVIGGSFSYINGTYRYNVARLNPNGTVDGSFSPTNNINSTVMAVAVQTNNAVIIGGTFNSSYFPLYNARLNPDGTTDTSFSSIPNGPVYAIAVQPNGQILIGGAFTQVNGTNRNHIARLNGDGSLDNTFQSGLTGTSSTVRSIQVQSNGSILIGGDFTVVNGYSRTFLARLTSTGALDTGFAASGGANNSVYAMAIQPDGEVVIGGAFTSYYPGANLSHVARLYDDGTRDTTFTNWGINNTVEALALQSDGAILMGGVFTSVNNTNVNYLARLYGDLYPPEFSSQPRSVNTNVGANVTFSAQVSNPTTTSFQWEKDGVDIPGATDMSYSLFKVQLADAGTYSVFVTDEIGGTTSSNAVLQVGIPPAITSQPISLTVTQGQSATFAVGATGQPLNYAWYDNGAPVAGQTNATLLFAAVDPTNAGTYTCKVSNFLGAVTSTGAVLNVLFPPVISAQPLGQYVVVGSNFTVSVTASGDPALSYQWRTNGAPIPNAISTNYTVTDAQITDSGAYDVIITNAFGSVTSMVAQVSVGYPPVLIQQPLSVTNAVGGTANFSCSVTGSVPINLQWTLNGNPLAGATNISLTISNLQPANIGYYVLTATNNFGGVVSSNAALNLAGYSFAVWNGLLAYYPFNGNANDASGNGNNGVVSNAVLISDRFGAPSSAYSFNGSNSVITSVVSNLPTGAASRTLSLWVETAPQPSAQTLAGWGLNQPNQGFGILNTGSPYDWWGALGGGAYDLDSGLAVDTNWHQIILVYDTTNLLINVDGFPGALEQVTPNTVFTPFSIGAGLAGATAFFSGSINDVRIYNLALTTNSVAALYALEADVPVITQQPQSQSFNPGGTANFSVTAIAAHPLFYQWQLNGTAIPGATNTLLTLTNLQSANLGDSYSVTISNGFTGVLSASATLTGMTPALGLASVTSQGVSLNITGIPLTSYVLQSTTNLAPPVAWQSVLTNQTDTNGLLQISDTNLSYPQKFYRITTP